MAKKFGKQLKKDVKKISKQVFSNKGLMIKRTYDTTTSFYGNGKEKKPYITISAHGDYKISVAKLIVILMCILSTAALIILCIKALADHCRPKKPLPEEDDDLYYEYDDDEEIPF